MIDSTSVTSSLSEYSTMGWLPEGGSLGLAVTGAVAGRLVVAGAAEAAVWTSTLTTPSAPAVVALDLQGR